MLFFDEIKKEFNKEIVFKDSKSECGLKIIDFVVSYYKNNIQKILHGQMNETIELQNNLINYILPRDDIQCIELYKLDTNLTTAST
jgi:hypothetical protein